MATDYVHDVNCPFTADKNGDVGWCNKNCQMYTPHNNSDNDCALAQAPVALADLERTLRLMLRAYCKVHVINLDELHNEEQG